MPTTKLNFFAEQANYEFKTGNGVISIELDGGFPRRRLDVVGEAGRVKATWIFTADQFSLFMSQYRVSLNEGTDPALIPLLTEFPAPVDHKVTFLTDTFSRTNRGLSHTVSVEMQVLPNQNFFITQGVIPSFTPGFPSTGRLQVLSGTQDFDELFVIGDKVHIIGLKGVDATGSFPDVDLDGEFIVNATFGTFALDISSPEVNAPGWAQLPSMTPVADSSVHVIKVPE